MLLGLSFSRRSRAIILGVCCVATCNAEDFLSKELRVEGRIQSVTVGDVNGDGRPVVRKNSIAVPEEFVVTSRNVRS